MFLSLGLLLYKNEQRPKSPFPRQKYKIKIKKISRANKYREGKAYQIGTKAAKSGNVLNAFSFPSSTLILSVISSTYCISFTDTEISLFLRENSVRYASLFSLYVFVKGLADV